MEDKLKQVLSELSKENRKLLDEASWLRKHNHNIEAQIIGDKFTAINEVLLQIQMKVLD